MKKLTILSILLTILFLGGCGIKYVGFDNVQEDYPITTIEYNYLAGNGIITMTVHPITDQIIYTVVDQELFDAWYAKKVRNHEKNIEKKKQEFLSR